MNYILTVIDIFSKYAWGIPIKNKTGKEITRAFSKIFEYRSPRKLHTDKGLEFINKDTQSLFRKYGIHWFSTENETKAQVVERFNRTLKTKMFKLFTHMNTKRWINVIDDLLSNYNNSYHRSIRMTPIEASQEKNEKAVYNALFPEKKHKLVIPRFEVGDRVRISKKRKDFVKGYLPNFTQELFIVTNVLETDPITYKIKDMNNEEIIGSFYEQEMVKYNSDVYEIEKILNERKGKLLVKWRGYQKPSWISKMDIQ